MRKRAPFPYFGGKLVCVVCGVGHRQDSRWIHPLRAPLVHQGWAACRSHPADEVERAITIRWLLTPWRNTELADALIRAYRAEAAEEGTTP